MGLWFLLETNLWEESDSELLLSEEESELDDDPDLESSSGEYCGDAQN